MRAKKRILLAAWDEDTLAMLHYKLANWGYAVERVTSVAAAADRLAAGGIELLVADWEMAGAAALFRWALECAPDARTLALAAQSEAKPELCCADGVVLAGTTGPQLRECVAKMAARRRGPLALKKPGVRLRLLADMHGVRPMAACEPMAALGVGA
jgi:CheY-like chemotaxis protein